VEFPCLGLLIPLLRLILVIDGVFDLYRSLFWMSLILISLFSFIILKEEAVISLFSILKNFVLMMV